MIFSWAKANQPERAQALLNTMRRNGCQIDIEAYGTVIRSWAKNRRMDKATQLVATMAKDGLQPTLQTYNDLVAGWARSRNNMNKATELFQEMAASKDLHPDRQTYTIMAYGFLRRSLVEQADSTCLRFAQGLRP